MEKTLEKQETAHDDLSIVRVYFFEPKSDTLFDRCFQKGITDYQKTFGYKGTINHCAIQLGRTTYETAMDGTIKYNIEPEEYMAVEPRLLAYYELDISEVSEVRRKIAKFYLEGDLQDDRRWELLPCLRYLYDYTWQNKFGVWLDQQIDYNLPEGRMEQEKGVVYYNLPFTCATLVANVFNLLYNQELEPMYDAHLPMAIFSMCCAWADQGVGSFVSKADITVEAS